MKILFAWTGLTRCAGDCWRALAALPGAEPKIVFDAPRDEATAKTVFHSLDYSWADDPLPAGWRPDVLFAVGWHSRAVRSLVERADWKDVPKVFCFDMPWRARPRCVAARFVLRRYLKRFRAAYVPGESARFYASWLGFKRIEEGFLAMDTRRFAAAARAPWSARKGFLYVGRDAPEKRVDAIRAAHALYRSLGGSWEIELHHETPYAGLPAVYARSACLVLASAHDPWPLVALEAKAAGCEVILSSRCADRYELEARVVRYGNVRALAREMLAVERCGVPPRPQDLDLWDCRNWAERTLALAKEVSCAD